MSMDLTAITMLGVAAMLGLIGLFHSLWRAARRITGGALVAALLLGVAGYLCETHYLESPLQLHLSNGVVVPFLSSCVEHVIENLIREMMP